MQTSRSGQEPGHDSKLQRRTGDAWHHSAVSEHPDRHRIELDEIGWANDVVGDTPTVGPLDVVALEVAAFMIDFTRRLDAAFAEVLAATGKVTQGTSNLAGRFVFGGLKPDDFPRQAAAAA